MDVIISRVHDLWQYGADRRKALPVIDWMTDDGTQSCSSSYVTEILDIAPYVGTPPETNIYFKQLFHRTAVPIHRSGNFVADSPIGIAQSIVARLSHLDIPFGFSEDRMFAVWSKAGHPGLRGSYDIFARKLTAQKMAWRPIYPMRGVDDDIFDYGKTWWIHVPTFRKWLLRALPHVIRTQKDFIADCVESAKRDIEQYQRDINAEYFDNYRYGT
jgi:hypothetical protein